MERILDLVIGNNSKRDDFSKTIFDCKWRKQQHERRKVERIPLVQIGPKITCCWGAEFQEHAA